MKRQTIIAAIAAGSVLGAAACAGDTENAAFTAPLETALKGIDLVERDLSTPERAMTYHWARQDARAIALCEAKRLRMASPASREARIVAAALATELPWDDIYDGTVKAHLRHQAATGTDDCLTVVPRYERRLIGIPQNDGQQAIITAQIRNVAPIPDGVTAPNTRAETRRTEGAMYRFTLRKVGEDWRLSGIEERPNYDSNFGPIMNQTAPGYPTDVQPL